MIVSDPAKLAAVGAKAFCNPGPGCTDQWSFTRDQANQVSADLERSTERVAYEKLYPLGYHVFQLVLDRDPPAVHGTPRDPRTYRCGTALAYPWYYYSKVALSYATTALLEELDPLRWNDQWQVLVMSRPPARASTLHGKPPSDNCWWT